MNPLTLIIDPLGIRPLGIFFGLCLCAGIFLWKKSKEIGVPAAVFWGYAIAQALAITEFPFPRFDIYSRAFESTAGQTLCEILLIPAAILAVRSDTLIRFFRPFVWLSLAIVWIEPWLPKLLSFFPDWAVPGAFVSSSFNLAIAAAFLPFSTLPLVLFTLATVVTHHGSTALLIIFAQFLAYYRSTPRVIWLSALLSSAVALAALAYLHNHGGRFLDGEDRLRHWQMLFDFWLRGAPLHQQGIVWPHVIFGVGPGTLMWTSMGLEFGQGMFGNMHSDWLQILWELGVVGLLLAAWTYLAAILRVWRDPVRLAALLGLAAFALTYHPLRAFPGMLLAAIIFKKTIEGDQDHLPSPLLYRD